MEEKTGSDVNGRKAGEMLYSINQDALEVQADNLHMIGDSHGSRTGRYGNAQKGCLENNSVDLEMLAQATTGC